MDNLVHITQYVRLGIILAACQPATACEVLQYDEKKSCNYFGLLPLRFGLFPKEKKHNFFLETEPQPNGFILGNVFHRVWDKIPTLTEK